MRMLVALSLLLVSFTASAAPDKKVVEARVRALVASWVDAQNRGDFAAYEALYAPTFRGVRRSGVNKVELDYAGWMRDRERMFKRPMRVKVDSLVVTTSSTPLTVEFVQWFSSGSFDDRGRKRLRLVERNGQLAIDSEELLESLLRETTSPPPCAEQRLESTTGPLVLKSCVSGQRKSKWGDVEETHKVTLTHGADTTQLGDVGSAWEWDDSWHMAGILTSTSAGHTDVVVLVRTAADSGDDSSWKSYVELRALAPGLRTEWSSHDVLLGADVQVTGDHAVIVAKRIDPKMAGDERLVEKLGQMKPSRTTVTWRDGKASESK